MDEMPPPKTRANVAMQFVGLLTIVVLVPICVVCSAVAGIFVLEEFVNGLIPTRWFSTSIEDWLFGTGAKGSARNYFGFILSSVPASLSAAGVKWGYGQVKRPKATENQLS